MDLRLRNGLISLRAHIPNQVEAIYNIVNQLNHEHRLVSRCHPVAGSRIRSYELVNSHQIDDTDMLKKMIIDCNSDDIIYDIGSNIGTYTLALGQKLSRGTGEIVAFEPVPKTYLRLMANIEAEGIAETVQCLNVAASNQNQTVKIFSGQKDRFSTISKARADDKELLEGIAISTVTVDSLDLPEPTVLKIDTEGHELDVLRGATGTIASSSPVMYIEPHKNDEYEQDDLEKFLLDQSYKIDRKSGFWIAQPISSES